MTTTTKTSSIPARFSLTMIRELTGYEISSVTCAVALTSPDLLASAEEICHNIGTELSGVMARTERLAATPDRDGMLHEPDTLVEVKPLDLRAYRRFGNLAEVVGHYEPTEYWKSAPYLVNFMERYKLKEAIIQSAADDRLTEGGGLDPGPGLLNWEGSREIRGR